MSGSQKYPSMPFYPADFFADTEHMSPDAAKAHMFLLGHAWIRGAKLPNDDDCLARLSRVPRRSWTRLKPEIMTLWNLGDDGFLHNDDLTKKFEWVCRKVEVNRRNGAIGGNSFASKKHNKINETDRANALNSLEHTKTKIKEKIKKDISPSVSLPLIPDEPEAEALDAPAKPSPKRKHQLPDDFDLTPEMIAAAERHGINGAVRDVFEHFCAHHRSKGTTMLRWDLAWITWLKNQKRFGHGPPLYKQRKSKAEECAELMEMWRLEDERKNEGSFETEFNGLPSNVSILRSKA